MSRGAKILLSIIGAVLLALVSFVGGCRIGQSTTPAVPPDTLRIHTVDTLRIASVPDTVTTTVTRYVSVSVYIRDTDTIRVPVMVPLLYEQHFARIGEVADVWFSGYDARIDSAVAYEHHTTEIVNHIADVSKMMPRLTAGVGCGAFYQEKRVNAYLFGEMRYNAQKSTFAARAAIDQTGRWCVGGEVGLRFTLF